MAEPATSGIPTVAPDAGAAPFQRINAPSEAFGSATAQATQAIGAAATKAGQFFGEVQVDDQANDLFERWNKKLRGDANVMTPGPDGTMQPDTGYMGLRGRNALDARQKFEADLDADYKAIRKNMVTPWQQAKFDDQTRRYRQHVLGQAGSHADREATVYSTNVNRASSNIALTHIANNSDNIDEVKHGLSDLINAKIKEAQMLGGGTELLQAAKEEAVRSGTQTWLQAVSARNPQRALDELERNKAAVGPLYDNLHKEFRARADAETGNKAGERAVLATYTTHAPAATVIPVFEQAAAKSGVSSTYLMRTWQLESGGRLDPGKSSTGAEGPFQFVGSTARQYGVANPRNFAEAADGAARLAADNKAMLASTMGRPPTDAELYLAHQQGAGGAAALLKNPSLTAQEALMTVGRYRNDPAAAAQAIRVNGGDPNAPAAQFTGMWSTKFNGAGVVAENLATRKQQAFDTIEADPSLSDGARQRARSYLNQQFSALQIAEGVTAAAKREAIDRAADGYTKRLLSRDPAQMGGIHDQIVNDPNLDWRTRNALTAMVEKHLGTDANGAAETYGKGFWEAWRNISAPVSDPARITDPTQLMERAGPGGDLTVAGVEKLTQWIGQVRKNPDAQAVHTSMTGLMNYAKGKLSFQQDLGPVKLADPKGEAIFNGEFIPKFQAAYAQWTKDGKNPWEFLTRENVDKMMAGMRPKGEMEMSRLSATGDAVTEDKNAPLPPAPAGVDAKAWTKVVSAPPATDKGAPFPKKLWGQAIEMLAKEPTPEKIKQFNESKFGKKGGYDGAKILEQLGVMKPVKEPEKPLPPGSNAPHNLVRRAVGMAPIPDTR